MMVTGRNIYDNCFKCGRESIAVKDTEFVEITFQI
jgi:hypothetical protein